MYAKSRTKSQVNIKSKNASKYQEQKEYPNNEYGASSFSLHSLATTPCTFFILSKERKEVSFLSFMSYSIDSIPCLSCDTSVGCWMGRKVLVWDRLLTPEWVIEWDREACRIANVKLLHEM